LRGTEYSTSDFLMRRQLRMGHGGVSPSPRANTQIICRRSSRVVHGATSMRGVHARRPCDERRPCATSDGGAPGPTGREADVEAAGASGTPGLRHS